MQRFSIRRAALLIACAVLLALVWTLRAPLGRAGFAALVDLGSGGRAAFDSVSLGRSETELDGVRFTYAGVPVLTARRIRIAYRLRDLWPGGTRRFGLERVELDAPEIVLARRADGSFALPGGGLQPAARPDNGARGGEGAGFGGAPLRFALTVRAGRFTLLDPARKLPDARRFVFAAIAATATVDGAGVTAYRARGTYEGDAAQTVTLAGRIDVARGYAEHRLRAPAVSLAPLANYFINTPSAAFLRAPARALDLRAYAFARAQGLGPYHVAGSAQLAGGALRIPGLLAGASALRGRLDLTDDGLASPGLTAQLGPARVRLAGGLFDWSGPQFRLGLSGTSDLQALRTLFRFSRTLPLEGSVRIAALLEGPAGSPLVATRLAGPALRYGAFPIEAAGGRVVYWAQTVDLLGVHGRYGGFDVAARGAIDLGTVDTQLVFAAGGSTAQVPYLAQAMPGGRAEAAALVTGRGLHLAAHGELAGAGPGTRLGGLLTVDANGDGALGPFDLRQGEGRVAGTFYLHRSASESGFWLSARDYPMVALEPAPRLPGLALVAPPFAGRLTGAVAGVGPPSAFRLAGRATGHAVRVGTVDLAEVSGALAGSLDALRLSHVVARGPWGGFHGRGAYTAQRLALEGAYRGDFARLVPFTGDLGAQGPVAGPVALLIEPQRTVVQAQTANAAGSRVRGLALAGFSGTLDARPGALRVFGATARVAGGTAVAAGTLSTSTALAFSIARAGAAGALTAPGLRPGAFTAVGSVGLRDRAPEFDGGVAVDEARYGDAPLAGNGDVTFGRKRLTFARGDALAGDAVGRFSGTVARPGTAGAVYDVALRVAAARLGPLARSFAPQAPPPTGTLAANVRVWGRGPAWKLGGTLAVPEGEVRGLGFSALGAAVNADPHGFTVRDGAVRVGSTGARFAAGSRGADASLEFDAPHADLADFNDLFDAGDTLGGRGHARARFSAHRALVATSADIAIAGLHYRRFDLGDATARVRSTGARVRGRVAFGGPSGTLVTAGTLDLAAAPVAELLTRSRFDGTASLAGLDLGVWLPALGYQLPITGRVDAEATIRGRLGNPDVTTTASVAHGTLGSIPVDRLALSATSTVRRTTIRSAQLALPSFAAQLAGSFGFGERDPLALTLHLKTSDLGVPARWLSFGSLEARGSAEADVKIEGTRAVPRVAGSFDVEAAAVRGVAVPQALGQFSLHGRDVVLSGVETRFATGSLALAGSVPLEIEPFGFGPPQAQIALEASATDLDLASFAPLLPAGSTLAGHVNGRVLISGTAGDPRLGGGLALAGGSLRTPWETIPVEDLAGRLGFEGHEVRLERLQARVAGGTVTAAGRVEIPDLVHPTGDATFDISAAAERAAFNFPAYGGGQVTGTLEASRRALSAPLVRGSLTFSDATIPFSALLGASGTTKGSGGAPLPNIGFNLALVADRNVRVRSANVDIGARGSLHVGGTLAAPVLAGGFTSTGGTLSYFNTVFRLLSGTVAFQPDFGVIPTLDARAITHVIDPDPNTVRNAAGSADITLALSGPLNALTISLASNPSYGRQQILGLLLNAPAFGATSLFGETAQNPTYYGSANTAALPASVVTSRNAGGELSVAQEAFGIANAQFTRTLLAPFETTFAGALGLSNFNLNVDYTGNVGLSARKVLGKDVNAIFDTSFGYPYRQTFGFEIKPSEFEAAQVTVFETLGAYDLNSLTPASYLSSFNAKVRAAQPVSGSSGFSLSIQRLFP